MLYYKVKPNYDNAPKFKLTNDHRAKPDGILVGNELYTPAERAKIANGSWFFDEVEISRKKIYWFFGARFEG